VTPPETVDAGSAALLALAACSVALLAAVVACLWFALKRLARLESALGRLDKLDGIHAAFERMQEERGGLDLRRLEHVLIDIRDGQKRVEDRMLAVLERSAGGARGAGALQPVTAESGAALADRIVSRMLALGYEREQLVTPTEAIGAMVAGDGEVTVEARREGAACKGRIVVKRGAIVDVQLQSAYTAFP
jgi:hypothetical protein